MHATTTSSRLRIKRLVLAALMLALAYVLPFFTGNIPQIGSMLLPMHPVSYTHLDVYKRQI